MVKKTGPGSYRIKDQLTSLVTKTHAKHFQAASIEEWKIPTTERSLQKIIWAATVDSSNSDSESGEEQADFPVCKCQHRCENSDNEFDIPLMECHMLI